jgi:hypothetical protein
MLLTRDQILSRDDATPDLHTIEIPEWGGSAFVRVLSGKQRERFEKAVGRENESNLRGLFAALCLCDDKGKPIFTEADISALGEKSSKALDRVYRAGIKLNAIGKDDIDELEKNSEAAT